MEALNAVELRLLVESTQCLNQMHITLVQVAGSMKKRSLDNDEQQV